MENQNCTPDSSQGPILDVKPLQTLSPMFPPSLGFNAQSSPVAPFVCVTPFGSSDSAPGQPFSFPKPTEVNGTMDGDMVGPTLQTPPPMVAPLNEYSGMCQASKRTKQRARGSGTDASKMKKRLRKRYPKMQDTLVLLSPSQDPREPVEVILMTYDALRRRLQQLDEVTNVNRNQNKYAHLKAGAIMMDNELRLNANKTIGDLQGIKVGDIFYFRFEMCLVGLHTQSMAGIDYMNTTIDGEDDTLAVSIVSAGVYEDDTDNVDELIYSGQGGSKLYDRKIKLDDQKLERGNLALERSLHRSNPIRVIRGTRDNRCQHGKAYFYDGLYKIHESWIEKGKSGFNVFKYKLVREPGQADGFALWKMIETWRKNPPSRGDGMILQDISSGEESVPVYLVNEVDTERGPGVFSYSAKVTHSNITLSRSSFEGCGCVNLCLPGNSSCSCAEKNGSNTPYISYGMLVKRMPVLYECGDSCRCSQHCRNRVVQKGTKLQFEVFRTQDSRGWGLRSWDPIRAGTFICEYVGEIIPTDGIGEQHDEDDDYIFDPNAGDETFRWNYGPELLGEPSPEESLESLSFLISAKRTGNVARFINHSCSPNIFWQPILYDHGDENYPHVSFFAIKHIPPLTELTYDYGQSGRSSKKCLCGSTKCRGLFG